MAVSPPAVLQSLEAIDLVDREGRFVSPRSPDGGETLFTQTPTEQHPVLREFLERAFASGTAVRYELPRPLPDGRLQWIDRHIVPLPTEGGAAHSAPQFHSR